MFGHGFHPSAGEPGQLRECRFRLLLAGGRSLTVSRLDPGEGRLHTAIGLGKQVIDRCCGGKHGIEQAGAFRGYLRHQEQLDLLMEGGLGCGDHRLVAAELLLGQGGVFLAQFLLPGGLGGQEVAGLGQRLVFRAEPQPELRAEQGRDDLSMEAADLFAFGLGNEGGGFIHFLDSPRTKQLVDHA